MPHYEISWGNNPCGWVLVVAGNPQRLPFGASLRVSTPVDFTLTSTGTGGRAETDGVLHEHEPNQFSIETD